MSNYQNALIRIKNILNENPRGLTIQELSRGVDINRNSIAKYLDVMLISGHVEMRPVGRAKMYYYTDRVPMSAMLNISSEYIVVFNKTLEIIQVNNTFLDFFHITREAILGKKLKELPINMMKLNDILSKFMNNQNTIRTSSEISLQINNSHYYLIVNFIPTTFEDGEQGITLLIRNITKRKQMEETLKANEARYRNLFLQSPIGIDIASPEGIIINSNQALHNITGYSKEELERIQISTRYVYPEKRKELLKILDKDGAVFNFQVKMKRKDGTIYTALLNATKIQNSKGEYLVQTTVQDITEQKQIERRLKESEMRFRELTELLPTCIFENDIRSNVTYMNPYGLALFGYTQEDLEKGLNSTHMVISDDREKLLKNKQKISQRENVLVCKYRALKKDGTTFNVQVDSVPIIHNNQVVGTRGIAIKRIS